MKEKLKKLLSTIERNLFRIVLYELTFFVTFIFLISNIDQNQFNKNDVLNILISITSITVAIIVTYLFSKLFAEKTVRIERKKHIDELSIKITYLRRIAYRILRLHEFWKFKDVNIRTVLEGKFPELSYEQYRGYDIQGLKKFTYEEHEKIDSEIFGTSGQAYLALEG